MAVIIVPFSMNIYKGIWKRAFWFIERLFVSSRTFEWPDDVLCTFFEVLTLMIGSLTFWGPGSPNLKAEPPFLVRMFLEWQVAFMYPACQSALPKSAFWDTLATSLRVISPGQTVRISVPSEEAKFWKDGGFPRDSHYPRRRAPLPPKGGMSHRLPTPRLRSKDNRLYVQSVSHRALTIGSLWLSSMAPRRM